MSTKEVFDLTNAIKLEIVGDAAEPLPAGPRRAIAAAREDRRERHRRHSRIQGQVRRRPAMSASPTCPPSPPVPASSRWREVLAIVAGRGRHHRRHRAAAAHLQGAAIRLAASRARSACALITDFPLIAPHLGYTLVELFSRLRHRRHRRPGAGGGDHPIPVRREDRDALHPAAGHDADAGAGAAADPALRLRLHAAHHRGGACRRARW